MAFNLRGEIMKTNKILFALYQSDQGITETKSRLTVNFAQLKAAITFHSVPFIVIVERITFILSMTLIGQLIISIIKSKI